MSSFARPDGRGRPSLHVYCLQFRPNSSRILAGLPRRTLGDPVRVHRACEKDSPPAFHSQSDIQKRPRHLLRLLRFAVFHVIVQRLRSGRGTWLLARTPDFRRHGPCDRAETSTNRSDALPGTASRPERLPGTPLAWSGLLRRGQDSARCNTANTGADDIESNRLCRTGPGSLDGSGPLFGRPSWLESTGRNTRCRPCAGGESHTL